MPRKPRLHVAGGIYHVTLRGNHRQSIFRRQADRDRLDDIVQKALVRSGARIHAFVWMTEPYPSARAGGRSAARVPHATHRYTFRPSDAEADAHHRTPVRASIHALRVDVDSYFLELLRHIHVNPVRARMVATPDEYPWSSHHDYLAPRNPATGSQPTLLYGCSAQTPTAHGSCISPS